MITDIISLQSLGYGAILCLLAGASLTRWAASRPHLNIPPGPTEALGPVPRIFKVFHDYSQRYGPVFSVKNGNRLVVVIAGYKAAVEIMQKRGADLADRPQSVSAQMISGGEINSNRSDLSLTDTVPRILHLQLQPSTAKQYQPLQLQNAKDYIMDILRDPEHHIEHARRYAASVIMSVTYGKTTPTQYSDPEVVAVEAAVQRLADTLPIGKGWVDKFPFLRHFPLPEVKKLRQYHQAEMDLFNNQLDDVRQRIKNNEYVPPNVATHLWENQTTYGISNDELAYLTGSMFGAGSDTTATAMSYMAMAAALFPDQRARVQAQLDAVVGRDRLPTFEDQIRLPLVTAFALESHRWRPVSPSGFAHCATKDIFWNGYVIPAGATVIGNHWSVMHDPEVFPDPEKFILDRWLDENGEIRGDLKMFGFGFGRRVCPGQPVAERSLFINTALMCWAFDVTEDPSVPIDTMAFTDGAIAHPHPFKVNFEPRIKNLRELLQGECHLE